MVNRGAVIVAAVWLVLAASPIMAQGVVTGTITGRVTDTSGGAVAAANVTVTNTATGVVTTAKTGDDGYYFARYLQVGTYTVAAAQSGFQKVVVQDVGVSASSTATVNLQIRVGAVSESVTVSAVGTLLEAQNADRGSTVDTVRLDNFPSQAGNIMGLTFNTAGAQPTSNEKSFTLYDNSGATSISINGGSPSRNGGFATATNLVLVDGVYDRTSYNGAIVPLIASAQSTEELKVVTDPYSAEYGNTTGGAIVSITKSGHNDFHGSAWEDTRATGLSANTFERNLAGLPKLGVHFWQPGGSVGGPIVKNKLFFFFEMQSILSHTPKAFQGQVPTQAQRDGDFSKTFYNNGGQPALQTIYDPWTVGYNAQTGTFTRATPFPGNVIPANRINPVAGAAFWKNIPLPNANGDPITLANNYAPTNNGTARSNLMEYVSRVDYNLNDSNRLTVRYTRNNFTSTDVRFYDSPADLNSGLIRANHNAVAGYTKTLSPTTVLDVRLGFERWYTAAPTSDRCSVSPASLGFSSTFAGQALESCFPVFSFGGGTLGSTWFSGASQGAPNHNPDQVHNLSGTLAKELGRHSVKFGGQVILERYYAQAPGYDAGQFTFAVTGSNLNPQISAPSSGNPVASFLLGVGAGRLDINSQPARQNMMTGLYVQDDIRVTSKLKVNLGLRWDYDSSLTDRYNAITGVFDGAVPSPLAGQVKTAAGGSSCAACANLAGGLTFPGVNGQSRSPYDSTYLNFGPRLGVAYALDSRTVIRAGWGMFYNSVVYDPGSAGFSQTTNSVLYDPSFNPINLINNPFPNGLVKPVGPNLGLLTNVGTAVSFVDPHAREPRSQQFSFDVQREVGWKTLVTAGYVYNGVSRLAVSRNVNALTDAQMLLGPSVLNTKVTNPFAGLVGSAYALNAPTIAASALITPYPQFTAVNENGLPIGDSAYHALQVQLNKRFSDGLSLGIAYTFSKHLGRYAYQNPGDPIGSLQKTFDAYDMPHLLVISEAWEIPVGRGRRFGRSMPRPLDLVLGGWMFNGNIRLESGAPYQLATNAIPVSGVDREAPNQNLNQWVNPAAFTLNTNPYSLIGWSQMFSDLRLPWLHNADLQLEKVYNVTERIQFALVTNWVNAFNHPQFWNGPGACNSPSASCFGKIAGFQGQTNLPRQIQIGGKVTF